MRRALGTKAPAMLAHVAVEDRAQHLMQGLLDQPVLHRGNAQPARPAAGLGNVHRAHRRRSVVAPKELLPDHRPVALEVGLGLDNAFAVDPAGPGIGFHRCPGPFHVLGAQHRIQTDVYRVAHRTSSGVCARCPPRLDGHAPPLRRNPPARLGPPVRKLPQLPLRTRVAHLRAAWNGCRLWSSRDSSALRSTRLSPGIHTTMASADSWPALARQASPSKNMYSRPVPPGSTGDVFR